MSDCLYVVKLQLRSHWAYMGFDLLAEATHTGGENAFGRLLLAALAHVSPVVNDLQPYQIYPLTLTLTNQGVATPGRALLNLPASVTMVDAHGATPLSPSGSAPAPWQWLFTLAQAETRTLTAWVRLGVGAQPFTAEIESGTAPDRVKQATASLTLTPVAEPDLAATLAEVEALGNAYKHVAQALEQAQAAVAAGNFERALSDLVNAADAAIKTTQADALRLRIVRLVRVVGRRLNPTP